MECSKQLTLSPLFFASFCATRVKWKQFSRISSLNKTTIFHFFAQTAKAEEEKLSLWCWRKQPVGENRLSCVRWKPSSIFLLCRFLHDKRISSWATLDFATSLPLLYVITFTYDSVCRKYFPADFTIRQWLEMEPPNTQRNFSFPFSLSVSVSTVPGTVFLGTTRNAFGEFDRYFHLNVSD